MSKPNVLILGGCGFIGRNLVDYLVRTSYAQHIRIVDKKPPQMSWLNSKHEESFENEIVAFKSANLINEESCKSAFGTSVGEEIVWDLVVNCAGETKSGQTDKIYYEGVYKLSMNCAGEAARRNVKRYFELSSASMNSNEKTPQSETCTVDPWTAGAKYKAKIETELSKIPNLNYTVLRLPIVYGIGDRNGLTPRIIIASIYKYLDETMKLLWSASMKMNTVHVSDVIASIWDFYNKSDTVGEIYNIVDDSNTTQGSLTEILSDIFNIKHDFWGSIKSNFVKLDLIGAVEEINEKHMLPWAKLCQSDNIENTPLTPYLDPELLYNKHIHLDNSKLKRFGFKLLYPKLTKALIEDIINDYIEQRLFPSNMKTITPSK